MQKEVCKASTHKANFPSAPKEMAISFGHLIQPFQFGRVQGPVSESWLHQGPQGPDPLPGAPPPTPRSGPLHTPKGCQPLPQPGHGRARLHLPTALLGLEQALVPGLSLLPWPCHALALCSVSEPMTAAMVQNSSRETSFSVKFEPMSS